METHVIKLVVEKNYFKERLNTLILEGNTIFNKKLDPTILFPIHEYEKWRQNVCTVLSDSFDFPENKYKKDFEFFEDIDTRIFHGKEYWYRYNKDFTLEMVKFYVALKKKIDFLVQFINGIPLIESHLNEQIENKIMSRTASLKKEIFVVHGHNEIVKLTIARLLEMQSIRPIILHEQANSGKVLIEKFENNSDVQFAVILLTADDFGHSKISADASPRARQNVILELGYFIAKLGRASVCILYEKGVELPSDIYGLSYIELDDGGAWKFALCKELIHAGFKINMNKVK